jgi:hypothetical protein
MMHFVLIYLYIIPAYVKNMLRMKAPGQAAAAGGRALGVLPSARFVVVG